MKSLIMIVASVLAAFILLLLVFLLPIKPIDQNVDRSAVVFQEEGAYPFYYDWCFSMTDNFTDALMLQTASYFGDESLIDRTLAVYRYSGTRDGERITPNDSLVAWYDRFDEDTTFSRVEYSRYWHGYLLYLRPLLLLFPYQQIRLINTVFQHLLAAAVIFLLWRKGLRAAILPYLLMWLMLIPPVLGVSLQYSDVYDIFSIGLIILLLKGNTWEETDKICWVFLFLGIATSFFDLLTYPLATLTIPATIWFFWKTPQSIKNGLMRLAGYAALWGMGYIGMWAGKWVLGTIFLGRDVSDAAIQSILYRTFGTVGESQFHPTWLGVIRRNFRAILLNPQTILTCIFVLILLARYIYRKQVSPSRLAIFGVIAMFPFVWYFVVRNHSWIHYWFTCKGLVASALALMCAFSDIDVQNGKSSPERLHNRKKLSQRPSRMR